jgi:hypothetical protein
MRICDTQSHSKNIRNRPENQAIKPFPEIESQAISPFDAGGHLASVRPVADAQANVSIRSENSTNHSPDKG